MRSATPTPRARASDSGAAAPRRPLRAHPVLRALGWLLQAGLALLLAAGVLLWHWAGSDTSLASALSQAAHYLPAGQRLESRAVSGSLRSGGRIGWLRWSSPGLALDVTELRLGWHLAPLLQRRLELSELHAVRVQITPVATGAESAPLAPPTQWLLPLRIGLPFRIDQLHWAGAPAVAARGLVGDYRFDGREHRLNMGAVELAQGRYSARATLQAQAPMALDVTLDGHVYGAALALAPDGASLVLPPGGAPAVPGSAPTLLLGAQATLQGTLATAAAQLQLRARLRPLASAEAMPARPAPPGAKPQRQTTAPATKAQAEIQATLAPWAPQPLRSASAALRAVNLAALWPQAPATQLHGRLTAGPVPGQAARWSIEAQLRNTLAGPWDRGRLPVSALQASVSYDGSRWSMPGATIEFGAGSATAQGQYLPATGALQGQALLRALRPDALHSLLAAAPLSGHVDAQMQGQTLRFDADIRAAPAASTDDSTPLRINRLSARGSWQTPSAAPTGASLRPDGAGLRLEHLLLDALQARIEAADLRVAPGAQSAQGQFTLTMPGASVQAQGQIAPRSGAGELQLHWSDTERHQRWLTSLPWVGAGLQRVLQGMAQIKGAAQVSARWKGGWQTLAQQLQAASAGAALPGSQPTFELQATLSSAQIDLAWPSPVGTGSTAAAGQAMPMQSLQLRAVQAELSGSLAQARLALAAQMRTPGAQAPLQAGLQAHPPAGLQAPLQASLQTHLSAGLVAAGQWQLQISELRLQAQDSRRPGPWTLQLSAPLDMTVRSTARAHGLAVDASAGQARLTGPLPGAVALRWQPLHWSMAADSALRLQTRGTLQGLPLAWVDALGPGQTAAATGPSLLARMGLASDMLLDGQWSVDSGDTLRARASLRRASGDLRLQWGDDLGAIGTPAKTATASTATNGSAAGVRQAEIGIEANGDRLRADLRWDSERAGAIDASVSTRFTQARPGHSAASGLGWAADAPLAGSLHARLPDIGLWSILAPPGWRVRGTLDASATLSGTRNAPRWVGTLGADELALRSVLDGVDLQGGRLRATLRGNQLDITELRLQGGRGSSARIAGMSGNRTAAPQDGGTLTGTGRISWGDSQAATDGLSGIAMSLQAEAKGLQVQVRADRQISVSGRLQALLQQGQISLRGQLRTDRATIILPDESAPRLGADVVLRAAAKGRQDQASAAARAGQPAARAQTAKPPEIAISLDLGRDFALQGQGITTRLTGALNIHSSAVPGAAPRVTGELRTERGRYRAWGQVLDVEVGLIRFNGPYDNPSLDILALRPNISVRAGVQITGSAQAPRVKFYADPELPDAETLSWVVLGRDPSAGGAEAAMLQQAALALLGRKGNGSTVADAASRLGLDEIGFRGPAADEDASAAALTFGKRLSRDLYVTYEHSLSGTLGTLYIFYDLSRRLTLRGQTGAKSALDIIYTIGYD
ncbi:translocation/assembly module TamB domain-containing protein [Verminephrobacter eiseniae]|uniref:translocation/assembly module TamB domain-containing protein n=1 Tax=Verminephrobacter eiseniae TaxID=364317 RepID=UPI00223731A1|nr:translocation/assembly module TamB domain-containing protein [Verminephrobacter eiseniae]MCW5237050.1 DUF490 domain-containing protein [Verminephrobacter eiseniae]